MADRKPIPRLEEHIASRKEWAGYLNAKAVLRRALIARTNEFLARIPRRPSKGRLQELKEEAGHLHEQAAGAHDRALRVHEQAAELHKRAADYHEQHAAGELALGYDDRAARMQRRADSAREHEAVENERADRARERTESG